MGVLVYTAASTAFVAKVRNNRVRLWAAGGAGGGNAAGNAGVLYGGGGAGSKTTAATARAGGNGRAGYAVIDWIPPCGMGLMG